MPKNSSQGFAHILLLLVAAVGVLAFIWVTNTFSFRDTPLGKFFLKPFSFAAGLPTPGSLKVEEDDQNAILSWDGYLTGSGNNKAAGVSGYAVYWGVYDGTTITNPQRKLTEDKVIQLQPLTNGTTYGAYVQSVDNFGNVSASSPILTFKSDPSRVNTLRSQMNGFFDDFNAPAGAFDELKWNSAYAKTGGHDMTGQFINGQTHAHNQIFDVYSDRGQNVSRPRAIFDITPGVDRPNGDKDHGTITFDMDGSVGRDSWYLDIYDYANGIIDIPSRAADDLSVAQSPANSIRIVHTSSSTVGIFKIDSKGYERNTINKSGVTINNNPCCGSPLLTVKNVRKHWEIKVSKDEVIVKINGTVVADVNGWKDDSGDHTTGLQLPFNKSYVNWVQFSYNTAKADMASSLLHWDNFGFDAPTGTTQTIETHNYTDGVIGVKGGTSGCVVTVCNAGTDIIKVPDSISGAKNARLMFTNAPHFYGWEAGDYIMFNGVKYSMPDAKTMPQNLVLDQAHMRIADDITPATYIIPVTNVQTGDNTVTFQTHGDFLNIHLELDFDKASAPSYTQPINIWKYNPTPTLTGAGISEIPNIAGIGSIIGQDINKVPTAYQTWNFPNYSLQAQGDGGDIAANQVINGQVSWQGHTGVKMQPNQPIPQAGTVGVQFSSSGWSALAGLGAYPGHQSYQIWVDRQKVDDQRTDLAVPTPALLNITYNWDTTKFCNGAHEVYVVSFTPSGLPSQASYFQLANVKPGYYRPLIIYTSNPGQSDCSTKFDGTTLPTDLTFTATPDSAFPTPSAVATATPTATPVSQATATPKPSATITPSAQPSSTPRVSSTPIATIVPTATPTIKPSTTPIPTIKPVKRGDFDNNGVVNAIDLSYLQSKWGTTDIKADLNNDGIVNIIDLSILLTSWNTL